MLKPEAVNQIRELSVVAIQQTDITKRLHDFGTYADPAVVREIQKKIAELLKEEE